MEYTGLMLGNPQLLEYAGLLWWNTTSTGVHRVSIEKYHYYWSAPGFCEEILKLLEYTGLLWGNTTTTAVHRVTVGKYHHYFPTQGYCGGNTTTN